MQVPHEQTFAEGHVPSPESRKGPAELYQRYAAKLLAYLCKHLPSLHDAEDILFDVFLAVSFDT